MTRKQELIKLILSIDVRETEKHLNRLSIEILEGWIPLYRKWNPKLNIETNF